MLSLHLRYYYFLLFTLYLPIFSYAHLAAHTLQKDSHSLSNYTQQLDFYLQHHQYEQALALITQKQKNCLTYKQINEYFNCYSDIALIYTSQEQYHNAITTINQGIRELPHYTAVEDSIIGLLYRQQGDNYQLLGLIDSAVLSFKKAKQHFNYIDFPLNYVYCDILIAVSHYHKNEFEQARQGLHKALAFAQQHLKIDVQIHTEIYNLIGVTYEAIGDYEQALANAQLALQTVKNCIKTKEEIDVEPTIEDFRNLGVVYNNIGAILYSKGDYPQASNFYDQALNIYKKNPQQTHNEIIAAQTNKASALQKQSKHTLALQLAQKTLPKITNKQSDIREGTLNLLSCYVALAYSYYSLEQMERAAYYYKQALPLTKNINKYTHTIDKYTHTIYNHLGLIHQKQANYTQALQYLQKACTQALNIYGKRHPDVANIIKHIGATYADQQKYSTALSYYQKALIALSPSFSDTLISRNPRLDSISSKIELLNTLQLKAQTLTHVVTNPLDTTYLSYALQTNHLASQLIDEMRHDYKLASTKELLADKAMDVYEQAIQNALHLFELTQKESYLHQAFFFAEKGKAHVLLEAMQEVTAKQFTAIPTAVLDREKQLKKDLGFYQQKLFVEEQKEKKPDEVKIAHWREKVFHLQHQYLSLKDSLEQSFPNYYQLKYDIEVATIPDLRKTILSDKRDLLIEYFVGKTQVYLFAITPTDFEIKVLPKSDDFIQTLTAFRDCLSHPGTSIAQYTPLAHQAYQYLLGKVSHLLPNEGRLKIIPDAEIGYLPFEPLLTGPAQHINSFKQLPYLFKTQEISYAASSTLLLQQVTQKHRHDSPPLHYVGYAPTFSGEPQPKKKTDHLITVRRCSSNLSPLQNNKKEVSETCTLFGGQQYLDSLATKANFMHHAAEYKIIHLATHACVEDDNPMFSKIYFSDEALQTYELYNMRLPALLTVLSACNTGMGNFKRGEGMMSLSRAFTYAGCPSIITSLWSAHDKVTQQIMLAFYQHLKAGLSQSAALRQAKLDYLTSSETRPISAAPFYWATFIHTGNTQPILEKNSYHILVVSSLSIALCFLLIFIGFKGYHTSRQA